MGLIVGRGVVAHEFCDGLNTGPVVYGGKAAQWSDFTVLALDALAPIGGGLIAAHLFSVLPILAMVFLSLAAGLSHHRQCTR